jgi:predicted XRE-type DNA-binding protein
MLISNNITLETLNKDKFKFPKNVYFHLQEANNRSKQKLDNIIVVTGAVGSGKSNMMKGINGVYSECIKKRPYTLDDVYFLIDDVLKAFDRKDNKEAPIDYDEAVQGGTGKDGLTKLGFKLRKALITKRSKRHLVTLGIDNPKELNDKIIERCIAWYHIYYKRTRNGKYVKGMFKVFSARDLQRVWDDLKNYKYRFVEQHPLYQQNYKVFRCGDYTNLWFTEEAYDTKKDEQTKNIEDVETNKAEQQIKEAILKMREEGITQNKIAGYFGISRSNVSYIENKA